MPRTQDEAIAIQPARLFWIEIKRRTKEHRADFRTAEWQAEMSRGTLVDGIHGETASFIGRA